MKQARVNIRTTANVKAIRRETRNGRDVLIVPSATLPDGVVMNGIRYPGDEIAKSYKSLERTPAPLGHPKVNGQFVSASDPEGINAGYIGAWNENVRREGGRVYLDKIIDVEVAGRSDGGKAVLAAINAGGPVHTSTGLLLEMEPVENDASGAKFIARNMIFDHDAILLGEEGAATPEQGVGMMVNGQQIEVINSDLEERADREMDWAVEAVARAIEARQKLPMMKRIKGTIETLLSLLGAGEGLTAEDETETMETDMTVTKEQFDGLSAQVNTLADSIKALTEGLPTVIANQVKPLTDNLAEMQANAKAKDDAEAADLVAKIVKANVLTEGAAKSLTLNALRELAPKTVPGKAAALNAGGFVPGADGKAAYNAADLKADVMAEIKEGK